MSSDRRLAALVVLSLALHLLALSWITRPAALPLSLPTLEVLLVSPRQAPSAAPPSTAMSEQPGSASSQRLEPNPLRARDSGDSPSDAASDRRLSRQGPTQDSPRAAADAPDLPTPTIDRSRAITPPDPVKRVAAAGSASNRQAPNAGVILAIRRQLARYQAYPASARRRGLEGAATVRFVITRSGALLDSELLESSGSRHLDQAALKLVSDAAPYPPLPATVTAARLEVKIPIEYRLTPPAT